MKHNKPKKGSQSASHDDHVHGEHCHHAHPAEDQHVHDEHCQHGHTEEEHVHSEHCQHDHAHPTEDQHVHGEHCQHGQDDDIPDDERLGMINNIAAKSLQNMLENVRQEHPGKDGNYQLALMLHSTEAMLFNMVLLFAERVQQDPFEILDKVYRNIGKTIAEATMNDEEAASSGYIH